MDFDDPTRDVFTYSGMMIWIGTIVSYFLGGVIVDIVAEIPLKMGYGGWYVDRRRLNAARRRRRRY
jgi:hypothetical protein